MSYFHILKYKFILLLPLAFCHNNLCHPNEILEKGSSIESKNGVYKLILRESGDLELMCNDTSLWSSKTKNPDVDVFQYQSNGNLVIRKADGTYLWESKTMHDVNPPDRLVLQDDGNLVLYAGNTSKWHTNTYNKSCSGKFC